jgi:hypothetical protein
MLLSIAMKQKQIAKGCVQIISSKQTLQKIWYAGKQQLSAHYMSAPTPIMDHPGQYKKLQRDKEKQTGTVDRAA